MYWFCSVESCLSILVFSTLLDAGFGAVAQAENRTLKNNTDKTRIKNRLKQQLSVLLLFRMWIHVGLYKKQNLVRPFFKNN
jgi:hypothetical protein